VATIAAGSLDRKQGAICSQCKTDVLNVLFKNGDGKLTHDYQTPPPPLFGDGRPDLVFSTYAKSQPDMPEFG
jgi:hypothetical protein